MIVVDLTDEEAWTMAKRVCTAKELEALELHRIGLGYRRIALVLRIQVSTAQDRVNRAKRRIEEATR